jgi:hypothetical protein
VVARIQNIRHLRPIVIVGFGVLGVFKERLVEGFVDQAFRGDRALKKPGHRIRHCHRRHFAAGQDVVADREEFVAIGVDPLIDSFVMAADQNEMIQLGEAFGFRFVIGASPGPKKAPRETLGF